MVTPINKAIIECVGEYSVVSPFLLVYGTLRMGKSNYNHFLKGYVDYQSTYRLQKFNLEGICANYTGKVSDTIVVDLFKFKIDTIGSVIKMHEIHCQLDQLETGYERWLIKIINTDNIEIQAKIYPYTQGVDLKNKIETGDYLSQKKYLDYPLLTLKSD